MKHHIYIPILLLLLCTGAKKYAPQEILLEGDIWAPYVMDPASGSKGFMVEIAETIFKKAGYQVSFQAVPWTRSLSDANNNQCDGVVGIYFSQAKERKMIIPEEEIGISINKFFVKTGNDWKYNGLPSLKQITLGLISDYDYGELNPYIRQQQNQKTSLMEFTAGNDALVKNIRKLMAGRISALVEDGLVMNYFLHKLNLMDQIQEAGNIQPVNPVGIAFPATKANSVKYAHMLSDGIRQLRKSGELKKILDKYGVKDWK